MGQGFQTETRGLGPSALTHTIGWTQSFRTMGVPRWSQHRHLNRPHSQAPFSTPFVVQVDAIMGCRGLSTSRYWESLASMLRQQKRLPEAVCVVGRSMGSGSRWNVTSGKGLSTQEPQFPHL